MSRRYAQYATSMWNRGSDFRGLTRSEQGTYMMLGSQPDISAVGVLRIPIGMWSGLASDTTVEDIQRDLKGLAAARFIVIDEDELLVRTFLKWDTGYTNELRRKSIVRAAHDVQSPALRSVLLGELARVGIVIDGFDAQSDTASDAWQATPVADRYESEYQQLDSSFDRASEYASDADSKSSGVVGTNGDHLSATSHTPRFPTPQQLRAADHDELALIAEIRKSRPGWSKVACRNAISRALDLGYEFAHVAAAFRVVADDPKTKKPGRLSAPGPWWDATASVVADDIPVETHLFEPSADDPVICRCNAPRRNRRHTFAEGTPQ